MKTRGEGRGSMACPTRSGRPGAGHLAIACLGLMLAGCEEGPADPTVGASTATAPAEDPRLRHLGVRRQPGLSARATFLALADTASSLSKDPSPFRFTDIRAGSGVDFVHFSGMDRRKLYPTAFGSGVAILDYDGDGRMDLYFATCTTIPPGRRRRVRTGCTGTSVMAGFAT